MREVEELLKMAIHGLPSEAKYEVFSEFMLVVMRAFIPETQNEGHELVSRLGSIFVEACASGDALHLSQHPDCYEQVKSSNHHLLQRIEQLILQSIDRKLVKLGKVPLSTDPNRELREQLWREMESEG